MKRLLVGVSINSQQVYSSVKKIQESEQVAVFSSFCLCQYFLENDLVEIFILIIMKNAFIVEQSKAY